jgi:hypothetical protein
VLFHLWAGLSEAGMRVLVLLGLLLSGCGHAKPQVPTQELVIEPDGNTAVIFCFEVPGPHLGVSHLQVAK